jgi:hypothetical protein
MIDVDGGVGRCVVDDVASETGLLSDERSALTRLDR